MGHHIASVTIIMITGIIRSIVLSCLLACAFAANVKAPHWQELECEAGHKYLFSDQTRSWQDAREECELYAGWLVNIGSLEEQNCLLRYGKSQGYDAWYWTDAYFDDTWTWTHALDNSEVSWFSPKWTCSSGTDNGGSWGRDYIMMAVSSNKRVH